MVTMTFDYIRKTPVLARISTLSRKIDGKKNKLERYGGCLPSLEREIKNAESLLDDYLVEGAFEAMESLNNLQADLEELAYREAEAYLTPEQIVQADGIKSHLATVLGIDEQSNWGPGLK